jgi:hypothetical protein
MGCRSLLSSKTTLPHENTLRSEPADKPMSTNPPASEYLLLFRNNASANVVIDGPFAESKEAVAGFFVIQAGSLEEAVEVAKGCPGLEVGQTVEVRAFTTDPFENEVAQIDAAREDRYSPHLSRIHWQNGW